MPSYLVETFLARGAAGERQARERRARSAAEAMTRERTRVRFKGSIHVPEDEICFFTFAAASAREAALVAQRAELEPLRVEAAQRPRHRTAIAGVCCFGTDKVHFSLDSRITGTTREYDRLSDVVKDVNQARVLVGFHFFSSDQAGAALGRKVAKYDLNHTFRR